MKRTSASLLPLLAVLSLGVTACGGEKSQGEGAVQGQTEQQQAPQNQAPDDQQSTDQTEEQTGGSESASSDQVSFVAPADGATVGSTFSVALDLKDFDIAAENVGKENADGEGHIHFELDEGKFDFPKYSGANGELAEQLGVDGKYSPSVTPTITYKNIPAGEHTLKAYLANNDHSESGAVAQVKITVKKNAPSVSFVQPKEGASVKSKAKFSIKFKNFKVDAKGVGQGNKKQRGHIHFQMDGGKFDFPKYSGANGELAVKLGVDGKYSPSVTNNITYKGLPKGAHTIRVFLVNNDHSDTGVVAVRNFTVK